eukprot:1492069-Pyramimonas_sp.AAC.1
MGSIKFRSLKLKHVYNLAGSTGLGNSEAKRDRANEGGEVLLFRQHLQVHRFPIPAEEVPDLCADGHSAYDRFFTCGCAFPVIFSGACDGIWASHDWHASSQPSTVSPTRR